MINFDLNKTLDELEKISFEESDFNSSVILNCQKLRTKKLKDFSIEDLRLMIGQKMSLNLLVPIALDALESNPFAEGDFYKGDLLVQLLRVDKNYWKQNEELLIELNEIVDEVKSTIEIISPLINEYES